MIATIEVTEWNMIALLRQSLIDYKFSYILIILHAHLDTDAFRCIYEHINI